MSTFKIAFLQLLHQLVHKGCPATFSDIHVWAEGERAIKIFPSDTSVGPIKVESCMEEYWETVLLFVVLGNVLTSEVGAIFWSS